MWSQKLMWIAWPAFLCASALELLVFAVIDPGDLHWAGEPLRFSRQAVYTAAFFLFWAICMVSSSLTALLGMSSAEVNRCPVLPGERPDACRPQ